MLYLIYALCNHMQDEIKGSPSIDAPHHSQPVTTNARHISKIDLVSGFNFDISIIMHVFEI